MTNETWKLIYVILIVIAVVFLISNLIVGSFGGIVFCLVGLAIATWGYNDVTKVK